MKKQSYALLGFAILAKIFPAILLVYLVAQRRWREILWTFIFIAIFSGLSLGILGVAPVKAFLSFELSRLNNGQAFTFFDREGLPQFRSINYDRSLHLGSDSQTKTSPNTNIRNGSA
jgi:hypothetical protein